LAGKRGIRRGPFGLRRRTWLGGLAAAGLAGATGAAYRAAPQFWHQFARELGEPILPPPQIPDPSRWSDRGIHACWIGQSTALVKVDGFTILTDPVFSTRAGIDLWVTTLGVKRIVAPALDLEDLPPVDLILLSHAHMDHFDLPSLRALQSRATHVVTARATADLLRTRRWAGVTELGWGESARIGPARVQALEVNHWGARVRTDTYRGYNGYLVEVGRRRILFGGDTAMTGTFRAVRASKPVDLAIMPIGAYNPWIRYHCTPEQALEMGNHAGAEFFLPVHHRTFRLGREPFDEPIERFREAVGRDEHRIAASSIGEEFRLS
jgi:L-ascorbate metabolism protein UlaG (beta-lactamase superfamily)